MAADDRRAQLIEAASDVADEANPDPMEVMMRQEAVETAVSRFAELPLPQRSVVILKDVLDESLKDIADLLNLSVDAVKAHLARGRARLREVNAQAATLIGAPPVSAAVVRYVALFNQKNWDELRALLYDPQTSGGLLVSVASEDASQLLASLQNAGLPAAIIGRVSGPFTAGAGEPAIILR